MAQSKIGGTKSFIHGKVGNEVYYTDHDLDGNVIQVIKSMPPVFADRRSLKQNKVRMTMSTVMQAIAAMRGIIDHTFDNVANGEASVCEFYRKNFALLYDYIDNHQTTYNNFGYVKYKGRGITGGKYIVSYGDQPNNDAVYIGNGEVALRWDLGGNNRDFSQFKTRLDLGENDFITIVEIRDPHEFLFCRLKWVDPVDLTAKVNATNIMSAFQSEGNLILMPRAYSQTSTRYLYMDRAMFNSPRIWAMGCIVSKYVNGSYQHNICQLNTVQGTIYSPEEALSTYPIGKKLI